MAAPLSYPHTPQGDHVDTLHGQQVADPYRWLEALDAPETRAWIDRQNALTFAHLESIGGPRQAIRERLTALWSHARYSLPRQRGTRLFYTRNDGLQNQAVLYLQDGTDGEPRVLLDPNALSADGTIALVDYRISPDGSRLAYGLSEGGSDWQRWRVLEVDGGADLTDELRWVKWSAVAWQADGEGLIYGRYAPPTEGQELAQITEHQRLFTHTLGAAQDDDALLYERPDEPTWGFHPEVSEDGRWLIVTVWHGTHRESNLLLRDLTRPDAEVVELIGGFAADHTVVGADGDRLYVHTDRDAPLGRVVAIDVDRPAPDQWRELIPEGAHRIESVRLRGDRLVVCELAHAHSRVRVFGIDGRHQRDLELPGPGSVLWCGARRADPLDFYAYTSFDTPGTIYRCDLATGERAVFRQPELPFDPSAFVARQVRYTSRDGTEVPMFVCHRADVTPDGDRPTYLYGYGGFDISLTPAFSPGPLVWMERGGVYVQANLRGGGEYGKAWHEAGVKANKQNVFDDFVAAAEHLVASGWTRPERLAIGGGSNGGLLVGACVTQRPELFGAAVASVGVLDMLRFHQWTIGWAWVSDYGSPDDPDDFATLLAYSPYHNLRPGTAYPPMLLTTGDHDDRVFPAHSFKFAAQLQACQAGPAPALIRIDTRAGHGMGKPTAMLIDELTDRWAFVSHALGHA